MVSISGIVGALGRGLKTKKLTLKEIKEFSEAGIDVRVAELQSLCYYETLSVKNNREMVENVFPQQVQGCKYLTEKMYHQFSQP